MDDIRESVKIETHLEPYCDGCWYLEPLVQKSLTHPHGVVVCKYAAGCKHAVNTAKRLEVI